MVLCECRWENVAGLYSACVLRRQKCGDCLGGVFKKSFSGTFPQPFAHPQPHFSIFKSKIFFWVHQNAFFFFRLWPFKQISPSKQDRFPINNLTYFLTHLPVTTSDYLFVWIVDWHIQSCQDKNWSQVDRKKTSPSHVLVDSYLVKIYQGINF